MSKFNNVLNRFSRILTQDKSQGASQSMLYAVGMTQKKMKNPFIAVASMGYDINPCNSHLNQKSEIVKKFINQRNRLNAFIFNTVGVSDGISMGTDGMKWSLPSRELIADSIETNINAHFYDGAVILPGCDKNIPAAIMAMARYNRPSFIIYGGSTYPGKFKGQELDIVSSFQSYAQYKSGEISNNKRQNIVKYSCPGPGSCGGMYTANTMASICEVMGLSLPNSSSNPALSEEKFQECRQSEKYIYNLLKIDLKPRDIITKSSIENGIKLGLILGGSTNLVLHMLAIAHSFDINLSLKDFERYHNIPLLLNLKPYGLYLMNDLHNIGGMSQIIKYLIQNNILDGKTKTITGKTLWENVKLSKDIDFNSQNIIHPIENPIKNNSHIRILYGNLAPEGSVSKITGKEGTYFKGNALVYNNENDFLKDLNNKVIKKGSVIVLRYMGPKGGPGMPEMLKPTSSIVGTGLEKDVALITDGRFSGGSHGFIIGHVAPEAYELGTIALVENGDLIEIDAEKNTINLLVNKSTLDFRKNKLINNFKKLDNNYLKKYQKLVSCSSKGCITI
jgi:dihydroxy-acid dehydratase